MWKSLLVVAGAFGATLLAIYLNNFVFKPVFSIDETCIEKIYDPDNRWWLFILVIKNVGLRAANNCIGAMTIKSILKQDVRDLRLIRMGGRIIQQKGLTSLYNIENFTDEPRDLEEENVTWYLGLEERSLSVTINKQGKAKLLLCRAVSDIDSNGIPVFLIEPSSTSFCRVALVGSRNYEGEVRLTANNANPRTIKFSIETDESKEANLKIQKVEPKTKGTILRQLLFGQ